MGAKKPKARSIAGRAKMRSPGRPPVLHRSERRPFWQAIAEGCSSEDAARIAGVSQAVGTRWFRECGGMPPSHLAPSAPPPTGRYLSFAEREQIALARARGEGVRAIARQLGRSASTISRELRRNAATRSGGFEYRAHHGAVACRSRRKASQACQTPDESCAADVCPGPTGRQHRDPGRENDLRGRRSDGRDAATDAGRPAGGRERGVRNRSHIAC